MDSTETDAYLHRIGAARPAAADAAALRDLHLRHLKTVPFENLSIHLGEEIVLDPGALLDKVVRGGRGGFCYELNGLFAELLTALGYRVTLLAGRVVGPDGEFGIPFDHLALRVETAGAGAPEAWLVDVGFGRNSHHPLKLAERGEQSDPAGLFRIAETEEGDLDVIKDGAVQYRLEQRRRELGDFEAGAWWHRTSEKSPFTRSPLCSLLTGTGRVTISGRTLVTTAAGGRGRQERTLADDELLPAYREHFGIVIDRLPGRTEGGPAAG
ncbi:acetyltransferase [Streptomyces cinnamoneus]|uniref:Acetyltransferase n=1 Tax=Streptomyces cinnamoneus TaxID=53446 RepID=A0A2G1XFS2_STRCJ|nr:arylamine N-acetyltransferase [Streptomyces cinnamoneus]PHQ50088.1 acetyltransferase [Streptomyces cinnamoneus]PPT13132.1 arylamine N-acetyltransferase [Streptomyces cinnamoneus]